MDKNVDLLEKEIELKNKEIEDLKNRISFLENQILNKNRKIFGKSSEKIDSNQLNFFDEAESNLNAKTKVQSLVPDVHFMPYPYSYRCPFGLGGDAGTDAACEYFERMLKDPESGITKPAAVILEPIQGEGGVIPAPVKFLQTVRRVTKELGIPMIVDEIQCGIGRSGKFFAFEYADIVPDVILVSKAIGGSQPLAVVVYNKELDKWNPGAHAGTFRGNQLAMRAGTALIKRVSQPEFLNEVVEKGTYMRDRLLELKKKVFQNLLF